MLCLEEDQVRGKAGLVLRQSLLSGMVPPLEDSRCAISSTSTITCCLSHPLLAAKVLPGFATGV